MAVRSASFQSLFRVFSEARNLPNKYSQQLLLDELDNAGFAGSYDFLYLPIDPETNANRGYARRGAQLLHCFCTAFAVRFVNFVSPEHAWMMRRVYEAWRTLSVAPIDFEGQKMGKFNSDKASCDRTSSKKNMLYITILFEGE